VVHEVGREGVDRTPLGICSVKIFRKDFTFRRKEASDVLDKMRYIL